MKSIGIIVAAGLILLIAMIGIAPATLADGRLAAATDGRLRIAEATGTVWRGAGALTDAGNTWQLPLAWSVAPAALVRGALEVTMAPVRGAAQPKGLIALTPSGMALTDFRATIPAQALARWLPLRDAPVLGGDIGIDAGAFAWGGGSGQGTLNAHWLRARLATTAGAADLGTVDVVVTPQDKRLQARVTNTGGDVRVNGTVSFTSSSSDGDITVTPVPGAPPALVRALAAVGKPDADGAVRLTWRNSAR
jgi:general secretion pathway protein N